MRDGQYSVIIMLLCIILAHVCDIFLIRLGWLIAAAAYFLRAVGNWRYEPFENGEDEL